MGAVYEVNINGDISYLKSLTGTISADISGGSISPIHTVTGDVTVPYVLDRTAIHYNTTATWNSTPTLVAEKGHIYVYSDYDTKEVEGETVNIPALKIGDGTSYLIDMPFIASSDDDEWIDHINNWSIHVSPEDRTDWNNKVSANVNEPDENLILSF